MTSPTPSEPVDVPDDGMPAPTVPVSGRTRRRLWIWTLVAAIVIAAPISWWQVTAWTYSLSPRNPGGAALDPGVRVHAGATVELCMLGVDGATATFNFNLDNTGHQSVTLTSIEPVLDRYVQTTSTELTDAAHFTDATQQTPVTLPAGGELMVSAKMTFPGPFSMGPGWHIYTDHVVVHFRVLGIARTQRVKFGTDDAPQYVAVKTPDPSGKGCGS